MSHLSYNENSYFRLTQKLKFLLFNSTKFPPGLEIDKSLTYTVRGVENSVVVIKTIGSVFIPLLLGTVIKEIRFHVIDDSSFSIERDGLIGDCFCKEARAIIDYEKEYVSIPSIPVVLSFYNPNLIPPYTRKIMIVKTLNSMETNKKKRDKKIWCSFHKTEGHYTKDCGDPIL